MQYKPLGNVGVQLPEIAFGTWNYFAGPAPLRALIERGPCLIDTAESYGNEDVVGEAMRGLRDRVFLATKVHPRNFRHPDVLAAADRSLSRLATDCIDLYQLHWRNTTVPIAETMQAMSVLADAGKIRFIGLSNFSARELRQAQAALPRHHIVSNQVRYSLVERTIERDLLDYCHRNAVTILAFSPLGMGMSHLHDADPERALPRVAGAVGKTEAQVALNWVISHERVIALTRASTVERIVENCGASGWQIPENLVRLLETKMKYRSRGALEFSLRRLALRATQMMGKI
jgi:diketogulonate reductase-like aldo/keto reductase